jgi:hypothetical protein
MSEVWAHIRAEDERWPALRFTSFFSRLHHLPPFISLVTFSLLQMM